MSQKAEFEPIGLRKGENASECEKTRLLLLKIKRSASKVEKLKPGLTQLVNVVSKSDFQRDSRKL